MTFEERVEGALRVADRFDPSPDLFAKVRRSIADDQAYRRRRTMVVAWVAVGLAVVGAYLWLTVDVVDGVWTMPFLALELLVTAVMVVIVLVVGPTIRRFGERYESQVFASHPPTGRRVLKLLDIAYYLIFGAFILMTTQYRPLSDFGDDLAGWVQSQQLRLAGLLLLMGVLHAVLIITLPVVGLLFAANARRARLAQGAVSTDPWLDKLDGAITVIAWVIAGLLILQVVGSVLNVLIVLGET